LGNDVNSDSTKKTYIEYTADSGTPATKVTVTVTYEDGRKLETTAGTQYPPAKQTGSYVETTDDYKSIVFTAADGTLRVENDIFLPTRFPGDPLNGADAIVPIYTLVGPTIDPNFIEFEAVDDSQFFKAQQGPDTLILTMAPFLFYDIGENTFYAAFHLPSFAGMTEGSPFFNTALPNLPSQAAYGIGGPAQSFQCGFPARTRFR
jgi:hypothetical protein